MSTRSLSCIVVPEYVVWRTKKVEDMVIPSEMEDVCREESSEVPSELEITKQVFEEEKKKMRIESRKHKKKRKNKKSKLKCKRIGCAKCR